MTQLLKIVSYSNSYFSGQECNISSTVYTATVRPFQPSHQIPNEEAERTTLAGIITVAILGVIILCIIVYFKFYRKFKRMKTELAHVHYIADPIQNGKPTALLY